MNKKLIRALVTLAMVVSAFLTQASACNGIDESTNPNNVSQQLWTIVDSLDTTP